MLLYGVYIITMKYNSKLMEFLSARTHNRHGHLCIYASFVKSYFPPQGVDCSGFQFGSGMVTLFTLFSITVFGRTRQMD